MLEMHERAKFHSALQAALKNTKVKLDLSTGIDILSMVEKGITRGIYY